MRTSVRGGLVGHILEQQGLFTRQQALGCGYTSDEIQNAVVRGDWRRIRNGIYAEQAHWARLSPDERALLEIRAASVRVKQRSVVSHWSAALVWGLDLHQPDLSLVHLTRPDRHSSRREAGIQHHVGRLEPGDVVERDGLTVTSLARTVVDLACSAPVESGLVAADSALRQGLDNVDLRNQLFRQNDHPGAIKAGYIVSHADGRAESPGETLCRYAFLELNLPMPDLQVEFRDAQGRLVARTDFAWPGYGVVGEFDGKLKYYRDLADGEHPGDILWREKRREDRLRREFGVIVLRITWADLLPDARGRLARLVLESLSLGKANVC